MSINNHDPFYFTEVSTKDSPLYVEKAFGPLSTSSFYLQTDFSAKTDRKAYAVCRGTLIVLENDDGSLNLVLKPKHQIEKRLPGISFFVYKGIIKSSIFSSGFRDGTPVDMINETGSELGKEIWEDAEELFNLMDAAIKEQGGEGMDPFFPYKDFIFPDEAPDADILMRDLNFDFSPVLKQNLHITAGMHIGDFDKDGFGFQVVMDNPYFQPDIGFFQKLSGTYTPVKPSTGDLERDTFDYKLLKEFAINFMDPWAFYGTSLPGGVQYRLGDARKHISGDKAFDALIVDPKSTFAYYRHRVYIDIRNTLGFSLNLMGDFDDEILIKIGSGFSADYEYYQDEWPIFFLGYTDFALDSWKGVYETIQLALPQGIFLNPALFLKGAIGEEGKKTENTYWKGALFEDTSMDLLAEYTKFVPFRIKHYTNSLSGIVSQPMSNYVHVRYRNHYIGTDPTGSFQNFNFTRHHLDQLFSPDFVIPKLLEDETSDDLLIDTYIEPNYLVDDEYLENNFVAARGIAVSKTVVTFFAFPLYNKVPLRNNTRRPIQLPGGIHKDTKSLLHMLEEHFKSVTLINGSYVGEDSDPHYWTRVEQLVGHSLTTFPEDPDIHQLVTLNLGRVEFNTILTKIETLRTEDKWHKTFPVYFGVRSVVMEMDEKGNQFQRYQLVLRGLREAFTGYEFKEETTGIELIHQFSSL